MMDLLEKLKTRIDEKSLRERMLIFLVIILTSGFAIHNMRFIYEEIYEVSNLHIPRAVTVSEINLKTARLRITQLQHAFAVDDEQRQILT